MRLLKQNRPVVFILLALVGLVGYKLFIQERYLVTSLDAGKNRRIRILADSAYEYGQPFYYEVDDNGETIVPVCFIGSGEDNGSLKFKLLYSKDRELVGVVEEHNPNILYVIHDFSLNASWPKWEAGRILKVRLQEDNSELELMLSPEVRGDVKRRLY